MNISTSFWFYMALGSLMASYAGLDGALPLSHFASSMLGLLSLICMGFGFLWWMLEGDSHG